MRALRRTRIDAKHLTGKTAVVTGAGSGIGRSLATLLAQRGAFVHAADLNGQLTGPRVAAGRTYRLPGCQQSGQHGTAHVSPGAGHEDGHACPLSSTEP